MPYVVRCRYIATAHHPEGVGYLGKDGRCVRDPDEAASFASEAEAWEHANASGERVPEDCWVEPAFEDHVDIKDAQGRIWRANGPFELLDRKVTYELDGPVQVEELEVQLMGPIIFNTFDFEVLTSETQPTFKVVREASHRPDTKK